ncbi:MAG: thioesterase family protein [Anaerolineaceae bacterium]|nr:thioesterase family protein [Anaerolineaceae bacterium]
MPAYKYYCPVQVRYGDLDPQWHVNNAHTLTFIEQARFAYLIQLGLFDGVSFFDVGLIVADVHMAYQAPIRLTQKLRIGVRVSRLGNKSLTFDYQVEDEDTGAIMATAETVMVAYNYHTLISIPVPADWREKITAFEGLST